MPSGLLRKTPRDTVTIAAPRPAWSSYIDSLTWKEGGKTVHSPGSNFFIEPDGTHVEGEFQAAKAGYSGLKHVRWTNRLIDAGPGKAKSMGRAGPMRSDWDKTKVLVMKRLVYRKFQEHETMWEWLDSTGEWLIVEGNWWCDQFWGSCRCPKHEFKRGENHLGEILTDVRWMIREGI